MKLLQHILKWLEIGKSSKIRYCRVCNCELEYPYVICDDCGVKAVGKEVVFNRKMKEIYSKIDKRIKEVENGN